MLTSELQERGTRLIEELQLSRGDTLQRWMAFYITELIERATHGSNRRIRETAAAECGELIVKLWQLQMGREAVGFRSRVYSFRKSMTDDDDEPYNLLANYVKDANSLSLTPELLADILAHLYRIEIDLVTLLHSTILVSNGTSDELSPETAEKIVKRNEELLHLKQLALVFPAATELDIQNSSQVKEFVMMSLQTVYELRMQFFA